MSGVLSRRAGWGTGAWFEQHERTFAEAKRVMEGLTRPRTEAQFLHLPEPDVAGVGKESGPDVSLIGLERHRGIDAHRATHRTRGRQERSEREDDRHDQIGQRIRWRQPEQKTLKPDSRGD
jgi:hypothetical protein